MKNLDWEESCNCKFNMCEHYDYYKDQCSLDICKKLLKK